MVLGNDENASMLVKKSCHYNDVTMSAMASQIISLAIVYSTVYSGTDQRKHKSSASLAFVREIHRWPLNSPHKWPVTRTLFQFDDVIMRICVQSISSKLQQTTTNRELCASILVCTVRNSHRQYLHTTCSHTMLIGSEGVTLWKKWNYCLKHHWGTMEFVSRQKYYTWSSYWKSLDGLIRGLLVNDLLATPWVVTKYMSIQGLAQDW